jgi:hypothetical protein
VTSQLGALVRKEWVLFFRTDSTRFSGPIRVALLLVFGTIFAKTLGPELGRSWATVAIASCIAGLSVLPVGAESFAGEREGRTLETLMTTPASEGLILVGKLAALVVYGASMTLLVVGAGIAVVAAEAALGGGGYAVRAEVLVASAVFVVLTAAFAAAAGMLVSLHARTVRGAMQTLGLLFLALTVVPMLLVQAIPQEWRALLPRPTAWVVSGRLLGTLATAAAVSAAVLLGLAALTFRRSRVRLD